MFYLNKNSRCSSSHGVHFMYTFAGYSMQVDNSTSRDSQNIQTDKQECKAIPIYPLKLRMWEYNDLLEININCYSRTVICKGEVRLSCIFEDQNVILNWLISA